MNSKQIIKFIQKGIQKETKINKRRVLGRPWSETDPIATIVYRLVRKYNYNNIMMHLSDYAADSKKEEVYAYPDYSGTFNFSRYIEKRLIIEVAKFLRLKFRLLSGYFTAGGTESNIYSLWVARNWAETLKNENDTVEWIIPESSHYSITKALNLLGITNSEGHTIRYVNRVDDYTLRAKDIINLIKTKRQKTNAPIILVMTVIDTEFGLNDPLDEVATFIKTNNYQNIFLHVDACFSGMVIPYLNKYKNMFTHEEISSIAVDFHKTFGAPTGSAMVLINDGYQKFSQIDASYLEHADFTLLGSRSGANVVITWAMFMRQVKSGVWSRRITNSIDKTHLLYDQMKPIPFIEVLYPPTINYLVFTININDHTKLTAVKHLLRKYSITPSNYKGKEIYKIIATDYISKGTMKKFIKQLRKLNT